MVSAIWNACTEGNLEAVRQLLKDHPGIDVEIKDHSGATPLIMAIRGGHKDIVAELLTGGANPFNGSNVGSPPESYTTDPDILELLAVARASYNNIPPSGNTPAPADPQHVLDAAAMMAPPPHDGPGAGPGSYMPMMPYDPYYQPPPPGAEHAYAPGYYMTPDGGYYVMTPPPPPVEYASATGPAAAPYAQGVPPQQQQQHSPPPSDASTKNIPCRCVHTYSPNAFRLLTRTPTTLFFSMPSFPSCRILLFLGVIATHSSHQLFCRSPVNS
ncbi:hypothetical protein DL93DRAFT_697933 [Clavulina sp. PMI_390]|nr:hypothetical protein DL93DRAFT_697933 [Clavulina sp. PMI_390]